MLLLSFDNDGGKRQIEEGLLCAATVTQTDRLRLYLGPGADADAGDVCQTVLSPYSAAR